jgi:M6 family metalloprotease-like protein
MKTAALTCGFLGLLLLASVQAQEPPPATTESLNMTGNINVIWSDPLPGSVGDPSISYTLVDTEGQRWRLEFDEGVLANLGGIARLKNTRVDLVGTPVPNRLRTLSVQEVTLPPEKLLPPPIMGSQPYIWVRLKFADDPSEPRDRGWYLTQALGDYPSMNHYWNQVSYQNVDVLGSNVTWTWIDLPNPRSHYVYEFDPNHEGVDFNRERALNDGLAAADPSVDFSQFVGINLIFNGWLAQEAFGGWSTETLDGVTRDWGVTWLGMGGWLTIAIVAHEMGHSFTMPHSSGPYGQIYDSHWDVMSERCGECNYSDPAYLEIQIGPNAYQKNLLGWIHPAHRYEMSTQPTVGAVFLHDLVQVPPIGRMLMGVIYTGYPSTYFTIERRRFTGYDQALPDETVVIHHVDTSRDNPAWVQDETWDGDPNDEGARWDLGETFYNYTYSTLVHVQAVDASGSLVLMTNSARPATFVDPANTGPEDGSSYDPWNTLFEGYGGVTPEGSLWVQPGTYYGSYEFNKPLTLQKWGTGEDVTVVGGS